jgi:hypothetical protein
MDAVMAQTMSVEIELVEKLDRMIASAETRRNATLREIERRRSGFAAKLRDATRDRDNVQNVQEAEFQVIDAPAASVAPAIDAAS